MKLKVVASAFLGVDRVEGRFEGLYCPFWTFDAMTATHYRGERGEDYTVRVGSGDNERTETRTRWYNVSGNFQRFFDDVIND